MRTPLAPFHAHAYDAYNLIANAIEKVAVACPDGSTVIGRTALRDAMIATKDMKVLTGNLTCTPTGDCADPKIAVYQGMSADALLEPRGRCRQQPHEDLAAVTVLPPAPRFGAGLLFATAPRQKRP